MRDLYDRVGGDDRSGLGPEVRALLAVCDLRAEVGAGGFDLYLRYQGGDTAADALAALPAVLGPAWADVLDAAMRTLGPVYPTDEYDRAEILDQRDLTALLDALDTRFSELESSTDADAAMNAYLADHSG